jgi:hypothetical protein
MPSENVLEEPPVSVVVVAVITPKPGEEDAVREAILAGDPGKSAL